MQKIAIVTGGNRGIGKSISYELAKEGFNVVISSKKQKESSKAARELENFSGVKSIGIAADVRDKTQVQKLIRNTIKEFKQIDVLINNAGIIAVKEITKTSEKDWDSILDTNLKGVYLCSKEVLPSMISKKSGCIINISSSSGKSGNKGLTAYCASKFGVNGFTESLASEVSQYGITVVAFCPRSVATDMQKQVRGKNEYEKHKDNLIQPIKVASMVIDAINGKYNSGSTINVC